MPNNAKAFIHGNLTRDPITRQVQNNQVVSMTVAVSTLRKTADNNYLSNFYDVTVWGKQGERLMQRLQKGSSVNVVGDLSLDSFMGKDNQMHYQLKLDNAEVTPIARLKDASEAANTAAATTPQHKSEDDEMPF